MKKLFFVLVSLLMLLSACQEDEIRSEILGVWVFESRIENGLADQLPLILDFKSNQQVIFSLYPASDSLMTYSFPSDSIMTIGRDTFSIGNLSSEHLQIRNVSLPDAPIINFMRAEPVNLGLSKAEIENDLLAKQWTIQSGETKEPIYIELLDNGIELNRYRMYDRNIQDTVDNLWVENWGLAEHDAQFFLYAYRELGVNAGRKSGISQILDIKPESFTITDANQKSGQLIFTAQGAENKSQLVKEQLLGKWMSKNTQEANYGEYLPERELEAGKKALFVGDLNLEITEKKFIFQIESLAPRVYAWQVSKDGKSIILEYDLDEPSRKGKVVDLIDLQEITEDQMRLRLFNAYYYTEMETPDNYLLNRIQNFERQE